MLFLHELILIQEADEKFEPFDDKNAIGVKFWSFMFLCSTLKTFCFKQKLKLFQDANDLENLLFYQQN